MMSITPKGGWDTRDPARVSVPVITASPAAQIPPGAPIYIIAAPPRKRSLIGRIVRFCLLAQLGILALFALPVFGPIVLVVAFVGLIVMALVKFLVR